MRFSINRFCEPVAIVQPPAVIAAALGVTVATAATISSILLSVALPIIAPLSSGDPVAKR
jgi:hypothetical protein